jgi:hypothetical protein
MRVMRVTNLQRGRSLKLAKRGRRKKMPSRTVQTMKEPIAFSAAIFLVITALLLCSCADHPLPPSTPNSPIPRMQGEGDLTHHNLP